MRRQSSRSVRTLIRDRTLLGCLPWPVATKASRRPLLNSCSIFHLFSRVYCPVWRFSPWESQLWQSRSTQPTNPFLTLVESLSTEYRQGNHFRCRGIFNVRTRTVNGTSVLVSPEGLDARPTTVRLKTGRVGGLWRLLSEPWLELGTPWSRVECLNHSVTLGPFTLIICINKKRISICQTP